MHYFIANFKQNLNLTALQDWSQEFLSLHKPQPKKKVILAPSFPYLHSLNQLHSSISLAAQDVSPFSPGAHTGQVSTIQIKDFVQYCIIGHSETRQPNDEQKITNKAKLLINQQITPIVCLDQPYLTSQLNSLKKADLDLSPIIYAFEPASAIGSNQPQTSSIANQFASQIHQLTSSADILYGGSVNAQNVTDYLNQEHINGVLVGSASLNPSQFAKIISCE